MPNRQHVLDKSHKTKPLKGCAGFEAKEGKEIADRLRQVNEDDNQAASMIFKEIEQDKPARAMQIEK